MYVTYLNTRKERRLQHTASPSMWCKGIGNSYIISKCVCVSLPPKKSIHKGNLPSVAAGSGDLPAGPNRVLWPFHQGDSTFVAPMPSMVDNILPCVYFMYYFVEHFKKKNNLATGLCNFLTL